MGTNARAMGYRENLQTTIERNVLDGQKLDVVWNLTNKGPFPPNRRNPRCLKPTVPDGDTGDNTLMSMWTALLLLSVSGVTLLVTIRRKWFNA